MMGENCLFVYISTLKHHHSATKKCLPKHDRDIIDVHVLAHVVKWPTIICHTDRQSCDKLEQPSIPCTPRVN